LAQLAKHKLALQFERDEEEEEGHQSIVDPLLHRPNDFTRTDLKADMRFPQSQVGISPPRVRQEQGQQCRCQQYGPRGRLDAQEL